MLLSGVKVQKVIFFFLAPSLLSLDILIGTVDLLTKVFVSFYLLN